MDLKKIMALAMMALMVIPSLTVTVGADEDGGVGMACAIERAQIYLDKVKASAEATAALYPEDPDMQGYLIQLYALLGQYDYEGPDFLLEWGTYGVAERSDVQSHSGNYSVHLETTGTPGDGDEARIVTPMPEGFKLGDLDSISWEYYLVDGYAPHVDIMVDTDGDGVIDDALVVEYAYNDASGTIVHGPCLTGAWYATFNDGSGNDGPAEVTNTSMAWATTGAPSPLTMTDPNFIYHSLADWKTGVTYTITVAKTINASTPVLALEFEVDNWIKAAGNAEAYVDDIKIDGVTYDFEEREEEDGQAKYYLDQASAYLDEGNFSFAARNLASARNILGRINGLLRSMAKAHKVTRTEKFNRRIQGIKDKIERQKGPKGQKGPKK